MFQVTHFAHTSRGAFGIYTMQNDGDYTTTTITYELQKNGTYSKKGKTKSTPPDNKGGYIALNATGVDESSSNGKEKFDEYIIQNTIVGPTDSREWSISAEVNGGLALECALLGVGAQISAGGSIGGSYNYVTSYPTPTNTIITRLWVYPDGSYTTQEWSMVKPNYVVVKSFINGGLKKNIDLEISRTIEVKGTETPDWQPNMSQRKNLAHEPTM